MHSLFRSNHLWPIEAAPAIQTEGRILRKPWACIVHALFSSNRFDNATRQLASGNQHWNINSGSAGLWPSYFG
jgi:hypothetical protein